MQSKRWKPVAVLFLLAALPARGELVTWEYFGAIDYVMDQHGLLGGQIQVNNFFWGSHTFDTDTPDALPGDAKLGRFHNALTDIDLDTVNMSFTGPSVAAQGIYVRHDTSSNPLDNYNAFGTVFVNQFPLAFTMSFHDLEAGIFEDDSIPVIPPPLDQLDAAVIDLVNEDLGLLISGNILVLTPEPGTLGLLVVGVLAVSRHRRPYIGKVAR